MDRDETMHRLDRIGNCEYCNAENVEVKEYDLGDGDKALGCVDEDRCRRQMDYNEWGITNET